MSRPPKTRSAARLQKVIVVITLSVVATTETAVVAMTETAIGVVVGEMTKTVEISPKGQALRHARKSKRMAILP